MPNGGKGAIAKIYVETEVIDNFKQQAAKIKSGLGNSLKDIKDLDLNFGFETESMARAAGEELNEVMRLATSQKLERLDFSGIFPGLTDYLKDNSIADELKLQVVQGLRKGLEDFSRLSSTKDIENLIRVGDGTDVWSNMLLSNATKDVIGSFGLKKKDNDIFLKQFKTLTSSNIRKDSGSFVQDLQQLLSLKATADNKEYQDVMKYLISGRYYDARSKKDQVMFDLPTINDAIRINDFYKKNEQNKLTEKDIRDFAGFFGRLQYLTTVSNDKDLHEIFNGIIGNEHFNELFNPKTPKDALLDPDQLKIFRDILGKVTKASQYKDTQYQAMDKEAFKSDISQAVNALFAAAGDNGTIARLTPLIHEWEDNPISVSADQLLAETIKSLHMQFEDNGLKAGDDSAERAEKAAGRAEKAADRAEIASETAVQAAEDIRQAIEDDTPQTDGKHNDKPQSQETSSTQSDDTAEHIADSAEADAENAEHIAETLEEKKERLENGLVEIRNRSKNLKDANKKYQKAIEETYDNIKTPEEALQLLKEKSVQLQQADSEFKGIESKRNSFTNPSNDEEIAILEEYNQKRANLEQAIIEYNKAGKLAVDRKVNPEDIRQNLVDEELLSFDSRGESVLEQYIEHLKQVIADNDKDIKNWEDLILQYQGQLDEVNDLTNRQQTGDTRNVGNENPQQNNAIGQPEADIAREEVNRTQKSREELQTEREKLAEEIRQSTETMSEAENTLIPLDRQINQIKSKIKNNNTNIQRNTNKKKEFESQAQQLTTEIEDITSQLQQIKEKRERMEDELKAYTDETHAMISSENYKKKREASFSLLSTENIIQNLQDESSQLAEERRKLEHVQQTSEHVKGKDAAYKHLQQMAEANKKAQEQYTKLVQGEIVPPSLKDFEDFSVWDKANNEFERQRREIIDNVTKASVNYVRAVQNAVQEKVAPSRISKYLTEEYDVNRDFSETSVSKDSFFYQNPYEYNNNDFISLVGIQESINQKNEQISELEQQIKEQQDKAKKLKAIVGDDWETNNYEARTKHAEIQQSEIDKLKKQEQELQDQKWDKEHNRKFAESDAQYQQKRINDKTQTKQQLAEELEQLQRQRDEQQRVYDEAKAIQEEKARQLEELDQLIAEAEARESAPASTPITSEDNGGNNAVPPSEQSGEESPVVQNIEEQIANIDAQITALKEQETQLSAKKASVKDSINEAQTAINEIQEILSFRQQPNDVIQKTSPQDASKILRQKAQEYKDLMKEIHATEREMKKEAKLEGVEESETSSGMYLAELQDKQTLLWNQFYDAYQTAKQVGVNQSTLKANIPEKKGDKNNPFDDKTAALMSDDLEQLLSNYQSSLELWNAVYPSVSSKYDKVINDIEELNRKRDVLKQKSNPQNEEEVVNSQSQPPLSSSGTQTADGVQQEGAEASDAATKMKALADAKKEALEANQKLAESADTTTNAIRNESNAGNFDELISKLIDAAKLLGQLPQSFEGFKGFDLEPLNSLSQAIQQFPKEGFNISLGDSFNNLANNIDKTLQKVQELTSQAKNAEIESTIAEKYDEQIKQLKADVEEAKYVIEELKKTKQDIQKTTSSTRSKKQETPIPVPVEPYLEDKIIGTNYKFLKETQQKLFDAKTVQDFQNALQEVENVLQRIQTLENEAVQKHSTPMDILYMAHNGSMSSEYESRMPESIKGRLESSVNLKSLTDNFVSEQQKMVDALQGKLNSIEIIPEKVQVNWGDQQREQYNKMAEGVKFAQASVKELSNVLSELQSKGFDAEQMKWFLELKEATTSSVDNLENQNNAFNNSVSTKSGNYLSKLSGAEKRLQKIKDDSEELIHIDPSLNDVLQQTEQHLKEIRKIKNTINKDPLQVLNPQFTNDTESYISQLYGTDDKQGVLKDFEQVSDRSQTDFDRIVSNYSRYTTALNKLFTDLAKGSAISTDQLTKDLARIDDLSSRLANGTGLNKNNLLTGELDSKADSKIVDAQTEAANKTAIAYESMFTKITAESESAKVALEKIFGTEGITKGLNENFIQGTVGGFDKFVQSTNQAKKTLKDLEDIQKNIKNDKTWILQEENIKAYHETSEALNNSLKEIANNASNFKIVDALDVQKLRASTAQFIKDNPALTGSEISELKNYIDQLQDKINTVDFKNIENGIQKVKQDAMEAGHTGETFFSLLTKRMKALGAYLLSFASFYRVIGVFKDGINIIHELDDALTEMQKVSDESLGTLREYQKGTFVTANEIGTTASQLQQSTADWLRLGEDLQNASQSAQTANILFNVSEFENINDATTALVAMSAAYADAEKDIDKMDIVDRLNLIGNNYAIATDELATALQDGAATLQTAGKQHCQNL